MNAEEPITVVSANVPAGSDSHKLPEQARVPNCAMPRQISCLELIYQWQPMGFRVTINLPFVSDDQSYLFAIRNGPFIPIPMYPYNDFNNVNPEPENKTTGSPCPEMTKTELNCYAWNNMRPVHHFQTFNPLSTERYEFPKDYGIIIDQYDYPPILSSFAQMFRRWRGDMQYRLRVVAGFATQGYLIVSSLKNVPAPIACYNPTKYRVPFMRQDTSYREAMMNSYIMADTSMFRHIEATMQFEYPVQWYDQFQWMTRRISPVAAVGCNQTQKEKWTPAEQHGDNYLLAATRGTIAAAHTGAQLVFEIEYRAMEGFQFADPFVPNSSLFRPIQRGWTNKGGVTKTMYVPNETWHNSCDGLVFGAKSEWPPGSGGGPGLMQKVREVASRSFQPREEQRLPQHDHPIRHDPSTRRRNPRESEFA